MPTQLMNVAIAHAGGQNRTFFRQILTGRGGIYHAPVSWQDGHRLPDTADNRSRIRLRSQCTKGSLFMKCYYHPDRDAVGTCADCGKFLCKECLDRWTEPVCNDCISKECVQQKKAARDELIMGLVCGILLGLAMAALVIANPQSEKLSVLSWLVFGFIQGFGFVLAWNWLKKLTSGIHFNGILILPIIGWAIYYMGKFVFGFMIAWFIAIPVALIRPFFLRRNIRHYDEVLKFAQASVESHEARMKGGNDGNPAA